MKLRSRRISSTHARCRPCNTKEHRCCPSRVFARAKSFREKREQTPRNWIQSPEADMAALQVWPHTWGVGLGQLPPDAVRARNSGLLLPQPKNLCLVRKIPFPIVNVPGPLGDHEAGTVGGAPSGLENPVTQHRELVEKPCEGENTLPFLNITSSCLSCGSRVIDGQKYAMLDNMFLLEESQKKVRRNCRATQKAGTVGGLHLD